MSTPQQDKTAAAPVTFETIGDSSGVISKAASRTRTVANAATDEDRCVEPGDRHAVDQDDFPSEHTHIQALGAADVAVSSEATPAGSEAAAFGEFLRLARRQRGVTLEQICKETKIPRAHLEALEQGDLARVPPGTYRRGEVVAYAAVVGLDRSVALARLQRALQPVEARQPSRPNDTSARVDHKVIARSPSVRTIAGVALAAAVMIVAASLWTVASVNSQQPATDVAPVGANLQPQAEEVSAPVPRGARENRENVAPASVPLPPARNTSGEVADRRKSTEAAAIPVKRDTVAQAGPDGRLRIITEPAGARVTINGVGWGVTPLTLDNLAPGTKRIRVTSEGFVAAERTINVPAVGAATVRIPLRARAESGRAAPPE